MKVIHVPFCYYPDVVGGTEIYVSTLVRRQLALGIEAIIAAPGIKEENYIHNGAKVCRFYHPATIRDLHELYDEGNEETAVNFDKVLIQENPDVVHLHAFTPAISMRLIRKIKKRHIPVVFTYHTPTVSCQCGLLLKWKMEVCNGKVDQKICTVCTLHRFGVPKLFGTVLSYTPFYLSSLIQSLRLRGKAYTALRMNESLYLRLGVLNEFFSSIDHFVAVSDWVHDVLRTNKVPNEKILISKHGLYQDTDSPLEPAPLDSNGTLRFIYLGRIDWTKGLDVAVKALLRIENKSFEFHIYGLIQSNNSQKYLDALKKTIKSDVRIKFFPPLEYEKILSILQTYHYLVVPSVWLETGPLVVLEAFLAKTPVLGSNLGGIAELVEDGVTGLLAEHGNIARWKEVFELVLEKRELYTTLRSHIQPPRKMIDVAHEMLGLYNKLLHKT